MAPHFKSCSGIKCIAWSWHGIGAKTVPIVMIVIIAQSTMQEIKLLHHSMFIRLSNNSYWSYNGTSAWAANMMLACHQSCRWRHTSGAVVASGKWQNLRPDGAEIFVVWCREFDKLSVELLSGIVLFVPFALGLLKEWPNIQLSLQFYAQFNVHFIVAHGTFIWRLWLLKQLFRYSRTDILKY